MIDNVPALPVTAFTEALSPRIALGGHDRPTPEVVALLIWGLPFVFKGFDAASLRGLTAEFDGAIEPLSVPAPSQHTFIHCSYATTASPELIARSRHRGGSSGDKLFLDGSTFPADSQNRDLIVPTDQALGFAYVADGCLCHSTTTTTLVMGPPGEMLLADLVEQYLLSYARAQGWVHAHAAGWVRSAGQVTVVAGDSGFGKTTALLRQVLQGARFLANDRLFLRLHENKIQARGYPLAMNIGCGTIRALGLPYNDRGLTDRTKLRLRPTDVNRDFQPDYASWFDVDLVLGLSWAEVLDNCYYVEEDPTHPRWNPVWAGKHDPGLWLKLINALESRFQPQSPIIIQPGATQ